MSAQIRIGTDHPSIAGHFPGNPIVPGVVILDEVACAIETLMPGRRVTGVPAVKFVSPLLPDETASLRLTPDAQGGALRFECRVDARMVATGMIALAPP